jgi:hypothetical protein
MVAARQGAGGVVAAVVAHGHTSIVAEPYDPSS